MSSLIFHRRDDYHPHHSHHQQGPRRFRWPLVICRQAVGSKSAWTNYVGLDTHSLSNRVTIDADPTTAEIAKITLDFGVMVAVGEEISWTTRRPTE